MNLTILRAMLNGSRFALGALVLSFGLVTQVLNAQMLQLNELDYYEKPGVLILNPDFPENKEDWPFLWGENEYVVNLGASYLYLVHAAMDLLEP